MGEKGGAQIVRIVLSACLVVLSSPAIAQDSDLASKRFDQWRDCLITSMQVQKTQTRDANLAAERSFQSCMSEERAMRDVSGTVPESFFVQMKADAKVLLLQEK
jgi:hypothetical protein